MGKVTCGACKKSCKGQAIRLQDKFFHVKCFKCEECQKQLAAGGFYAKDERYYCGECYQKLFGTKCAACGQFVEGEVVTALGNTYHQTCFHCTQCSATFGPGDKVTYNGKDYLCNTCLEQSSAVTTPQSSVPTQSSPSKSVSSSTAPAKPRPKMTSTPARPLSSPTSDTTDDMASINKENLTTNGHPPPSRSAISPVTSGYKSDTSSINDKHNRSHDSRDSGSLFDDYLTPNSQHNSWQRGGNNKMQPRSILRSDSSRYDSVFEDEANNSSDVGKGHANDLDKSERLSPIQNIMSYRSPSPATSTVSHASRKSRESSGSFSNNCDVNYGKFYNTTYMEKNTNYKRGPSINSACRKVHEDKHVPENFSFSQVRSDFIRPMKKENSSMMSALGEATGGPGETMYQKHKRSEPYSPMKSKDVIKLQHYPNAQKELHTGPLPIEREDWPAPPALAAAYPELLRREGKKKRRRRVRPDGTLSENETDYTDYETDASVSSMPPTPAVKVEYEEYYEDEEEAPKPLDPKTQREVDELEKMKEVSGAAKMVLKDLERKRAESPVLEPISASRTPAADREPDYKTRYNIHVFASPSRDLEYRPRLHSMDDILDGKKYRNASLPIGNFPVPKPGYTGGGGRKTRTVTIPIHATRNGGYHSDIEYVSAGRSRDFRDSSAEDLEKRSYYTDVSDYEAEYDPDTGLRRSRLRSSLLSDGHYVYTPYRRSIPSLFKAEEPPIIYPYDQLKMSNFELPPGVERNSVERHLSKEEFESIFHMNRQEFYRLAEWKRNDLKKRVGLF